jgi:hypothetical protein
MATGITGSVGRGGVNLPADVKVVQQLLEPFLKQNGQPTLNGNGKVDNAMIIAISNFQTRKLHITAPDGKVDPGGRTLVALLEQGQLGTAAAPTVGSVKVTYSPHVLPEAKLVSEYSFGVVRKALVMAKMKAAVITSTLRLPQEQAETMYKNAAKNLPGQFQLYGPTGDEILKIYKANQTEPQTEVVELMRKKIDEQLSMGRQVSRHVTTPARYSSLNVFDIGVNSSRVQAGASFDLAGLTRAFTKMAAEGYIRTFIDETAKSNTCWHLEIVPNTKPL